MAILGTVSTVTFEILSDAATDVLNAAWNDLTTSGITRPLSTTTCTHV
jgi:hypothetical protein